MPEYHETFVFPPFCMHVTCIEQDGFDCNQSEYNQLLRIPSSESLLLVGYYVIMCLFSKHICCMLPKVLKHIEAVQWQVLEDGQNSQSTLDKKFNDYIILQHLYVAVK